MSKAPQDAVSLPRDLSVLLFTEQSDNATQVAEAAAFPRSSSESGALADDCCSSKAVATASPGKRSLSAQSGKRIGTGAHARRKRGSRAQPHPAECPSTVCPRADGGHRGLGSVAAEAASRFGLHVAARSLESFIDEGA